MSTSDVQQNYAEQIANKEAQIQELEAIVSGKKLGWQEKIGKIIKYPTNFVSSLGAGAVATWALTTYTGASTSLTLAGLVIPFGPTAMVGGFMASFVTSVWVSQSWEWLENKLHQNKKAALNKNVVGLLETKIDSMDNAGKTKAIDFSFNQSNDPKIIEPNKMTDEIFSRFIKALKEIKDAKEALDKKNDKAAEVKVKKFDFTNAQMTDKHFKSLISVGLGTMNEQHLILRNNQLTNEAIKYLHKKIVRSKTAFQDLKSLDLSGNQLDSESLVKIFEIAQYLGLKSIDLSDNNLATALSVDEKNNTKLDLFLKQCGSQLFELKELKLQKVGLSDKNKKALKSLLIEANNLEIVDISKNADLSHWALNEYLMDGITKNISLRDFKSDHNEKLSIQNTLERKFKLFREIGYQENGSESRIQFLLQKLLRNQQLPESILTLLKGTSLLAILLKALKTQREQHLSDGEALNTLKNVISFYKGDSSYNAPAPVLNQFDSARRPRNATLKLLLDFENGLQIFKDNNNILYFNILSNKLYHLPNRQIKERFEAEKVKCLDLPSPHQAKKCLIAIKEDDSKSVDLAIYNIKEDSFETIHFDTLLEKQVQINAGMWAESLDEIFLMPENAAKSQSSNRLAS